jgi:hypothetical protein
MLGQIEENDQRRPKLDSNQSISCKCLICVRATLSEELIAPPLFLLELRGEPIEPVKELAPLTVLTGRWGRQGRLRGLGRAAEARLSRR